MTGARTKITLGWRPAGTRARRVDDFAEGERTALTTRTLAAVPIHVQPARRVGDIGRRLENWGRWAKEAEGKGADCMTGAICDRARRAAVGDLLGGRPEDERINRADAERINSAFAKLAGDHRQLLHWTYIECMKDRVIAKLCGFDKSEYADRLTVAQTAIELVAGPYPDSRR